MNRIKVGLSLSIPTLCALAFVAGLGPLNPPPGAVSPTTPSLADIETKIDLLSGSSSDITDGPYQSLFIGPATTQQRLNAQLEVAGVVLLHKIIVRRAAVSVFDGPGSMVSNGPVSGSVAGWAYQFPLGEHLTSTGVVDSTIEVEYDTVIEDGLYLAYKVFGGGSSIQILYKELD